MRARAAARQDKDTQRVAKAQAKIDALVQKQAGKNQIFPEKPPQKKNESLAKYQQKHRGTNTSIINVCQLVAYKKP